MFKKLKKSENGNRRKRSVQNYKKLIEGDRNRIFRGGNHGHLSGKLKAYNIYGARKLNGKGCMSALSRYFETQIFF